MYASLSNQRFFASCIASFLILKGSSSRRLNAVENPEAASNFKLAWPECFESLLSVEECADLIQLEVERSYYDVLNVEVVENIPRDPEASFPYESEEDNSLFHRFDIHTNYLGEVIGYGVDGLVHAITANGDDTKPWENVELDCRGMDVNQCTKAVNDKIAPINGKIASPWVKQQEPIPYIKGDEIGFCTWIFNDATGEYEAIEADVGDLHAHDGIAKSMASQLSDDIMALLDDGMTMTYSEGRSILDSCHLQLRSRQGAEGVCTDLDSALSTYNDTSASADIPLTSEIVTLLDELLQEIDAFVSTTFEMKATIEILSGDEFGTFVSAVPRLGQAPGIVDCVPGMKR